MHRTRLDLRVIIFLAVIIGSLLTAKPASAGDIVVVENDVQYTFAQQVTFTLAATSDVEISQVHLFFRATGDDDSEKVAVALEKPEREIRVRHARDVAVYPLPPFADITFWWQIEDVAGNQLQTEPEEFKYADNRFQWMEMRAGGISVHSIEGRAGPAYAQTALDIAQASVKDINAELRAPFPDSLDIYIYDTDHNLEAAMVLAGRDWVGGQARPELGVVVVAVPAEHGYSSRMRRYLPHEITHLLVYQLTTAEGYGRVPTWLDEGLATANERLPTPEYALALKEAYESNQLLSLKDLCAPFSPDASTAFLSYAQSGSLVGFIREHYGADGIRRLLAVYADGAGCTSGVEEALDISLSQLEGAWQASLRSETRWRVWVDQVGVWIGLWVLSALVAVPMIGRVQPGRSKRGP